MTLGYDSGIFSQELNQLTDLDDTKINNKTVTDGSHKVTTFTAGTGTVSWN